MTESGARKGFAMHKIREVVFPSDKKYLTCSEIPFWIARALHPNDLDAQVEAEREHTNLLSLAIEKRRIAIEPPANDASGSECRISLAAFTKYAKSLSILVKPTGIAIQAYLEEATAEKKIRDEEARNSGRYTLYEAAELATGKLKDRARLRTKLEVDVASCDGSLPIYSRGDDVQRERSRLDKPIDLQPSDEACWYDLNAWLVKRAPEIKWRFPDPASQKVGADKAKPEWMETAWEIGTDWMLAEEKRTRKRPSVKAIAQHVEGELSSRGTVGKHGRFLDWETIKRAALTGITGRGKGENLKNRKGGAHLGKRLPILKGQ